MSNRLYLIVSGAIFLLVGIFHFFRLVYHWPILVGTRMIPYALSYVGFPVSTGYFVWACWLLFSKGGAQHQPAETPLKAAKSGSK